MSHDETAFERALRQARENEARVQRQRQLIALMEAARQHPFCPKPTGSWA